MKRAILTVLTAALLAGVSACGDEPIGAKADYFPTATRSSWRYFNTFIGSEATVYAVDTSTYTIEKDTIVNGKRYALLTLTDGWVISYQWGIRKENGNYYSLQLGLYRRPQERLFLKDLPTGSTWEELSEDGQSKIVYTITGRPAEKFIRGKAYRDLIEVQEESLIKGAGDQFVRHYVVKHCYAKNAGRIYAYYPYPSFLTYGDQELELLEYTPN